MAQAKRNLNVWLLAKRRKEGALNVDLMVGAGRIILSK